MEKEDKRQNHGPNIIDQITSRRMQIAIACLIAFLLFLFFWFISWITSGNFIFP